jgi:hypothetical protein
MAESHIIFHALKKHANTRQIVPYAFRHHTGNRRKIKNIQSNFQRKSWVPPVYVVFFLIM